MKTQSTEILAKLLARENISMQFGNYQTAWFNPSNRVLGLPIFKEDMSKDLTHLLVGHEVGHALFTPSQGWHDAIAVGDVPKSYLNIVEDIRIERKVLDKYPGLVSSFKRGYKELMDKDFFGISNKNVNQLSFMDRLNLKSKLRDNLDIQFSKKEQDYYNLAMSVDTWEDVVDVSQKLFDFTKSLIVRTDKNEQKKNAFFESEDGSEFSEDFDEHYKTNKVDQSESEENDADVEEVTDSEKTPDSKENTAVNESNKDKDKDKDKDADEIIPENESDDDDDDDDEVFTDKNFRMNESSLLDDTKGYNFVNGITPAQFKHILIPFEDIKKSRQQKFNSLSKYYYRYENLDSKYASFIDETEKFVNIMVKEFELRKAAFQYSRGKTSTAGTLDVQKLYGYKFSDDIFKKIHTVANTKNHGMIVLVDYSGSMRRVMPKVLKQALILSMFCKKVNIPFEIYGFTTPSFSRLNDGSIPDHSNDCDYEDVILLSLISSSLSKSDYSLAYRQLFNQTEEIEPYSFSTSAYESLGQTPLDECLTAMPFVIENFINKHKVQKTVFTIISDGESRDIRKRENRLLYSRNKIVLRMNDGTIIREKDQFNFTDMLVEYLRKKYNLTTIGYFIPVNNSSLVDVITKNFKHKSYKVNAHDVEIAERRKQMNTNGFILYNNKRGYDNYFILPPNNKFSDKPESFDVPNNSKNSQIRHAFMKFNKSKKTNRIFATQFAKTIS